MCSISGFVSSEPLPRDTARRLCTALLYYGASRGSQSAGAYVNGKLAKNAMNPSSFTDTSDYFNLFTEDPIYALLHTRMPTSGGTGDAQAQPFVIGDTISIHNGMFYNPAELKNRWNIRKKSGVDSELLTSFVNTYGPKMLPKYIESTCGVTATAIKYHDEFYLMRDTNPLEVMTFRIINGPKLSVFASTTEILLNSLRYAWLIPQDYKPISLKDGILYKLTCEGLDQLTHEKAVGKAGFTYGGWPEGFDHVGYRSYPNRLKPTILPSRNLPNPDLELVDSIMEDLRKERRLTRRERKAYRKELKEALKSIDLAQEHKAYGSEDSHSENGG